MEIFEAQESRQAPIRSGVPGCYPLAVRRVGDGDDVAAGRGGASVAGKRDVANTISIKKITRTAPRASANARPGTPASSTAWGR